MPAWGLLLVALCGCCFAQEDRVLFTEVRELTLERGVLTAGRRNEPMDQLVCDGTRGEPFGVGSLASSHATKDPLDVQKILCPIRLAATEWEEKETMPSGCAKLIFLLPFVSERSLSFVKVMTTQTTITSSKIAVLSSTPWNT